MKTLDKLLRQKDQQGFRLARGYYVELQHEFTGMYPAVESVSKEMVMTTNINLLRKVCQKLPPRQFKVRMQLLYVNLATGIAYSVLGTSEFALAHTTPYQILTRERFRWLSLGTNPFSWMYASKDYRKKITIEEFSEAIKKMSVSD